MNSIKIEIMDYADRRTEVTIEDFDTVERMNILVLTGDEILRVYRKDGSKEEYDSSNCRMTNYYDMEYNIFVRGTSVKRYKDPEWIGRQSSYNV